MIAYTLGVEDLADTRFAVSPLTEAVLSLRALREPGLFPLHRPWRRRALLEIRERNIEQLVALVGPRLTLPDFLTPRPSTTAPTFVDELGAARRASPATVRRDLRATRPSGGLPSALRAVGSTDAEVCSLRDELCDQMSSYWNAVIEPYWSEMHQLLDADMTYRARRLAVGGARTELFRVTVRDAA